MALRRWRMGLMVITLILTLSCSPSSVQWWEVTACHTTPHHIQPHHTPHYTKPQQSTSHSTKPPHTTTPPYPTSPHPTTHSQTTPPHYTTPITTTLHHTLLYYTITSYIATPLHTTHITVGGRAGDIFLPTLTPLVTGSNSTPPDTTNPHAKPRPAGCPRVTYWPSRRWSSGKVRACSWNSGHRAGNWTLRSRLLPCNMTRGKVGASWIVSE